MIDEDNLVAESLDISNFELSQEPDDKSVEKELSEKNYKYDDLFEEENYDAKIHERKTEI